MNYLIELFGRWLARDKKKYKLFGIALIKFNPPPPAFSAS